MILTTTNNIEGHKVADYFGIVTATEVKKGYEKLSFKDSLNQEKYYEGMQNQIAKAKEEAFQKLNTIAVKMGANAIIGISVDVEVTTQLRIVISVVGTAVKVI